MIQKNLFFYISIICITLIPLPCQAMWGVIEKIPFGTIYNVASDAWSRNSPNIQWDEQYFQQGLKKQNYTDIMPLLYILMDDTNKNTYVSEWIKKNAEAGDVAMMYLFLRNKNRALVNKVGISQADWQDIGKYLLISFIRVYQDENYCTSVRLERQQSQSFLESNAKYQRDIITIFRNKYAQWFKNQPLEDHIPFADALNLVKNTFKSNMNMSHPIWVKYCYLNWLSVTGQIIFETPHTCTRISLDKRVKYYNEACAALTDIGSWFVLFSPEKNQNHQPEVDEDFSDETEEEKKKTSPDDDNMKQDDSKQHEVENNDNKNDEKK